MFLIEDALALGGTSVDEGVWQLRWIVVFSEGSLSACHQSSVISECFMVSHLSSCVCDGRTTLLGRLCTFDSSEKDFRFVSFKEAATSETPNPLLFEKSIAACRADNNHWVLDGGGIHFFVIN
jgi:hypothetical protein